MLQVNDANMMLQVSDARNKSQISHGNVWCRIKVDSSHYLSSGVMFQRTF